MDARPLHSPVPLAVAVAGVLLVAGCGPSPRSALPPVAFAPSTALSVPAPSRPAASTAPAAPAPTPAVTPSRAAVPGARLQLPRGGTLIFPRYRLVGYAGSPGSAAFGRLGTGDLDARVDEIERLGRSYAAGRQPLPVLELIAVVAQAHPGPDGRYRSQVSDRVIETYLAAARRHQALLLLNVQPGRAGLLPEVRGLERWLREPDVGVALDPEWEVGPHQVPGQVFGRTSGVELDSVSAYLAGLVSQYELPDKVMVVHQLAPRIITGFGRLHSRVGVEPVLSVDGIGTRAEKTSTWNRLVRAAPRAVHPGFKLFFSEDTEGSSRLMSPAMVLALRPRPEYVLYE